MGLDMYLFATQPGVTVEDAAKGSEKMSDEEYEKTEPENRPLVRMAYWRKANQIRGWFDRHIPGGAANCKYREVSKELLEKLLKTCLAVKENSRLVKGTPPAGSPSSSCPRIIEDPTIAEGMLPTTEGFFFGSQDYDEYYLDDILSTISQLKEILKEFDFSTRKLAYHEWW